MRFMILVKATGDSEAGAMPPESLFHEMATYHEALAQAGVLVDASGLQASSKGWRIRYGKNGQRSFVDGPFPETKEFLVGYWIIDCDSPERAVDLAAHVSAAPGPGGRPLNMPIELRQVMSAPSEEL